jgi:hypothetical protein
MQNDPTAYTRLDARLWQLADIMPTDFANWRTPCQARHSPRWVILMSTGAAFGVFLA